MQALIRVACVAVFATFVQPSNIATASQPPGELRWAGDPEGGAPFVEADPSNPDRLVGFDVEIADLIAHGLARKASFINITFTSIDQSIERGDADIGLSGIEDRAVSSAEHRNLSNSDRQLRGIQRSHQMTTVTL